MFSLTGHLAQHTGAMLPRLPVPGATQLSQPAPPPFTGVGTPYFSSAAPLSIAAPPAMVVPPLSPITGLGMTSLLAPSVAELVSASVAQPCHPDVTLPTATPRTDVPQTEGATVAALPETS